VPAFLVFQPIWYIGRVHVDPCMSFHSKLIMELAIAVSAGDRDASGTAEKAAQIQCLLP
jgi:hypothetical protein